MSARCDWAVIMARGYSRRMGRPKGLCRLPGEQQTFLSRIMALYREWSCPVAVVTTAELARIYAGSLGSADSPRWILRPAGWGTAATVGAAVADLGGTATHLWLHPVDLPTVRSGSLQELQRISQRESGAVIAPEFSGRPGHPVVLPTRPFGRLADQIWPGAMRKLLEVWTRSGPDQVAPMISVALEDPGIVADFDVPVTFSRQIAGAAEPSAGDEGYTGEGPQNDTADNQGDEGDEP